MKGNLFLTFAISAGFSSGKGQDPTYTNLNLIDGVDLADSLISSFSLSFFARWFSTELIWESNRVSQRINESTNQRPIIV